MLSKLLNSARNLFNPTQQIKANEEPSIETANTEMVTTRGQTGKHASQEDISDEDTIVVEVPRSSRKRSRKVGEEQDLEMADQEVSMSAKRQKALPLREKDDDGPENTVVLEKPVRSIPVELREVKKDAESSEEEEDEDVGQENEPAEEVQLEISDSESDAGSDVLEEPSKRNPTLPMKENKSTAPPKKVPVTTPLSVKSKHKRFGSEEPELEPEFFSTAVEIIEPDEGSSDDDAPEVVGAQDALKSAQSQARDAAKAVEEQESAIRKKRQDRDTLLKKQADSAAKKRKRAEEKEKRVQKMPKEEEDTSTQAENTVAPIPISRSNLPDLLPDEYLQDDSESEELMDLDLEKPRQKSKKMKFTDLMEKKPKDRRKGSTTYRVSEVRSMNLAPKSSFHARSMKEAWLKGRAGNGASGSRKVASGGFFKKK